MSFKLTSSILSIKYLRALIASILLFSKLIRNVGSGSSYFKSYKPSRTNPAVLVSNINGSSLEDVPSATILYKSAVFQAWISSQSAKWMLSPSSVSESELKGLNLLYLELVYLYNRITNKTTIPEELNIIFNRD